jgi:hypothetical protein
MANQRLGVVGGLQPGRRQLKAPRGRGFLWDVYLLLLARRRGRESFARQPAQLVLFPRPAGHLGVRALHHLEIVLVRHGLISFGGSGDSFRAPHYRLISETSYVIEKSRATG